MQVGSIRLSTQMVSELDASAKSKEKLISEDLENSKI